MQIKFQNDNDCSSHENKSHSQEIWQNFSNRLDETIKKIVATSSFSVPYLAMETRRLILRRVALKKKRVDAVSLRHFFQNTISFLPPLQPYQRKMSTETVIRSL